MRLLYRVEGSVDETVGERWTGDVLSTDLIGGTLGREAVERRRGGSLLLVHVKVQDAERELWRTETLTDPSVKKPQPTWGF